MTYSINGITLYGVNYRESDKMLTLFTLEKGKIGAAARGVRKTTAKNKQISEPFCFCEAVVAERSGRRTIVEVNSYDTFYPIRTDVEKYYAGAVALEFTSAFMPEELADERHFVLLVNYLKKLAYSAINVNDLLVKFLFDAVNGSGYELRLTDCGRCGKPIEGRVFLSSREGLCSCADCRKEGDGEFSIKTYERLKRVAESESFDDLPQVEEDRETAKNCLKFFNYYIKRVSGASLKSLADATAI